jgi:hypothetical protein
MCVVVRERLPLAGRSRREAALRNYLHAAPWRKRFQAVSVRITSLSSFSDAGRALAGSLGMRILGAFARDTQFDPKT